MPAVFHFCPDELFESDCGVLTKYSENTYVLDINAVRCGITGFFEPMQQIKYKHNNIFHTATLYFDNIFYIELENENSIYKKKLPALNNILLKTENIDGRTVAAVYGELDRKKYCIFIGYNEDYRVLGEYFADSISVDKDILIENTVCDMLYNKTTLRIGYDGISFKETERTVVAEKQMKGLERLVPYYFLECLLAKNYGFAIGLLNKTHYKDVSSNQLVEFFGDFESVLQNGYDKDFADFPAVRVGISKCFFKLKYFDFEIKNGLIENITEL